MKPDKLWMTWLLVVFTVVISDGQQLHGLVFPDKEPDSSEGSSTDIMGGAGEIDGANRTLLAQVPASSRSAALLLTATNVASREHLRWQECLTLIRAVDGVDKHCGDARLVTPVFPRASAAGHGSATVTVVDSRDRPPMSPVREVGSDSVVVSDVRLPRYSPGRGVAMMRRNSSSFSLVSLHDGDECNPLIFSIGQLSRPRGASATSGIDFSPRRSPIDLSLDSTCVPNENLGNFVRAAGEQVAEKS